MRGEREREKKNKSNQPTNQLRVLMGSTTNLKMEKLCNFITLINICILYNNEQKKN